MIFDRNTKTNNKLKKSYGILCVTAQQPHQILLNHSPSYPVTQVTVNNNFNLNYQELYNIFLSSFPNHVGEGEYTLPRGRPEIIDLNITINTKIREFIEETKLYHNDFERIINEHYINPNYKSIFNDNDYKIQEKWVGLDKKRYFAEYTVVVINDREELKATNDPLDVFQNYLFFNQADKSIMNRYLKKFRYDLPIDNLKIPKFIPLEEGLKKMNIYREERILDLDENKIRDIIYKTHKNFF